MIRNMTGEQSRIGLARPVLVRWTQNAGKKGGMTDFSHGDFGPRSLDPLHVLGVAIVSHPCRQSVCNQNCTSFKKGERGRIDESPVVWKQQ